MILASKIKVSRNFNNFKFPNIIDYEDSKIISDEIKKIFKRNKKYQIINFDTKESIALLNELNAKHIVTDNFKNNSLEKLLITNEDNTFNLMVNEENHLLVNAISYDDRMLGLFENTNEILKKIDSKFPFAFNEKYGYLTSSLKILGTGTIPSFIVHIPMIELSGKLDTIKKASERFGYTITPCFTKEEKSNGGFYEIGSKITLGISEKEIMTNLKIMISKIIEKEKMLRDEILKKEKIRIEDEVNRAYGIVTNAKIITFQESEVLISYIKLGCEMKLLSNERIKIFNRINVYKLLQNISDKTLKYEANSDDKLAIDSLRAQKIKNILMNKNDIDNNNMID